MGVIARHSSKKNLFMAMNLRLKAARVIRGLTQLQLAEMVGLEEIQISRLETGRSQATEDLKRRLSDALKKPAFELFES